MNKVVDAVCGATAGERRNGRRYIVEFALAMATFMAVLVLSKLLLRQGLPANPAARALVAVLPALPLGAVAWTIVRHVGRLDELQRHIQLRALAVAVVGTGLATFAWSLLEQAGAPRLETAMVWVILLGFWSVANGWINWRYRVRD